MEETAEDDDDARLEKAVSKVFSQWKSAEWSGAKTHLDDEADDWVLGIIDGGVLPLENAALIGRPYLAHDDSSFCRHLQFV